MKKLPKQKDILAAEAVQMYLGRSAPLSQGEIATRLNVDKATVSRLLNYARQQGLYSVVLHLPREESLEQRLMRDYGLVEAIVVPVLPPRAPGEYWLFRKHLAEAAARYLESEGGPLRNGQCIGISCGATIRDLINALTPRRFRSMTISQLTFETEYEDTLDVCPITLIGMLFARWKDEANPQTPPSSAYAIQPLPNTLRKNERWSDDYTKHWERIHRMAEKLDVAIIGISSIDAGYGGGTFFEILRRQGISRQQLKRLGVVGEICNRPYDESGADRSTDVSSLNDWVDGISLETLQTLVARGKKVIAVAGGSAKAKAIAAAMRSKFINYLVTDTTTAESICGVA